MNEIAVLKAVATLGMCLIALIWILAPFIKFFDKDP